MLFSAETLHAGEMLAAEGGGGGLFVPLLMLAALAAVTYFLIIRPNSQRRKEMMATQEAIKPGVSVVTIGGLHGTVVSVDEETVRLEVASGVEVTFARPAIGKVVTPTETQPESVPEQEQVS